MSILAEICSVACNLASAMVCLHTELHTTAVGRMHWIVEEIPQLQEAAVAL